MLKKYTLPILLIILFCINQASLSYADEVNIQLKKGQNFISIPLNITDTFIQDALTSIAGKYTDIWLYDTSDSIDPWKHYHPDYMGFSDLFNIEFGKGYWVEVTADCALTVNGSSITTNFSLNLKEGWNVISWPYLESQTVKNALYSLSYGIDYNRVLRFNPNTKSFEEYFNNPALNQFDTFEPGKAYYIYVLKDGEINLIFDITPPSRPTVAPVISPTNQADQTLTGTKEANSSIWINGKEKVPLDGLMAWSYPYSLQEGINDIRITSKDAAGNESPSSALSIHLDTSPPTTPTLNPVTTPANQANKSFSGTKESNSSIWIDGVEVVPLDNKTTWTYTYALLEGVDTITISSKDQAGNESLSLVKHAPLLNSIGDKINNEGEILNFTVNALDDDIGEVLTYFASNLPTGSSFNPSTKTFTWSPTFTQSGLYENVTFEVFDGIFTDKEIISINILQVNQPPVLNSIGPKTIQEGQLLEFKVTALDIDNDTLTYSIDNLPQGATFDVITQVFSWEPDFTQQGTYPNVHFEVKDNFLSDAEDITITVIDTNRAPQLQDIAEQSVTEEDLVGFTIVANDPDGDSLIYSAYNLSSNATFNEATGEFSWQTTHDDIGCHKVIFTVSDGELITSKTVTIKIASFNQELAYQHLEERMDAYFSSGPRLIETYMTPYPLTPDGSPDLVGKAFSYDNGLAILTFLSRGLPEDVNRAKDIVDAFMVLQDNDNIGDGRVKDFYDANISLPVDNNSGSSAGNMAWVIIAWLEYYKFANDSVFEDELLLSAGELGNFIITNYRDNSEPGFFIGFNSASDSSPLPYKSVEHNIGLYAAFMRLFELTGDPQWEEAGLWAKEYVVSKFNGEFFTAGTGNELVLDVNPLSLLSLGQAMSFGDALTWVETNMGTVHHGFRGFDFDIDKDGVWFEGTAQMSLAYQIVGRKGSSAFYLEELRRVQTEAIGANGKAIVAACHSTDPEGNVDGVSAIWFDYFASPHIASTCWYILAEREFNPFWGIATDEAIPYDAENISINKASDGEVVPPKIYRVKSPTNIPIVTISGIKAAGTSIWLNGKEIIPRSTLESFSYTILLTEGENSLRFTAKDIENKQSNPVNVTIVLDTVRANITITSPVDASLTNNPNLTVSGTVDSDAVMVEVNGALAHISGNSFIANNVMLIEGLNIIRAVAQDEAGNMSSHTTRLTLDTAPPAAPKVDTYPSLTNLPTQVISGSKDSDSSILLNGKEIVPIDLGTMWSYTVVLKEGANLLSFTSKDGLENESAPIDITITLDTIPPAKPTIGLVTTPTKITTQTITGTRSIDTADITLFSAEATIGPVYYPTATSWQSDVTLREGDNKIIVFAEDTIGNKIMGEAISIHLDTQAPLFEVTSPADGSYISGKE